MSNDRIVISPQTVKYHDIIRRCIRKEITEQEGATFLHRSVRQVQRLKQRVRADGIEGLIHRSRGKPGHHRVPDRERARAASLLHERYRDFKPTHASEKLAALHGIDRDPKTIRQIMIDEGLWKPRRQEQSDHRAWRQRKAHVGEMQQFDGSYEYWLEGRGNKCCLLLTVDDATGSITHGRFEAHEGVFPVFRFWSEYVQKHGKPMSIYLDRFSTYQMTQNVAKNNHDLKTQFERAMQELGIEPITAYSPEAKGRVERAFGVLQDRLIKEMRLAGIATLEAANQYLMKTFIPWYNARFAVSPRSSTDLHIPLTDQERLRLPSILSRHAERTVQNDFTVSYQNQWYQLTDNQSVTVCKRDHVTVEEHATGKISLRFKGRYLQFVVITKRSEQRAVPWVLAAKSQVQNTTFLFPAPHDILTSR